MKPCHVGEAAFQQQQQQSWQSKESKSIKDAFLGNTKQIHKSLQAQQSPSHSDHFLASKDSSNRMIKMVLVMLYHMERMYYQKRTLPL